MSWDVMIFGFASPPPLTVDKWPDDLRPIPLGETEDIRRKITNSLPDVDWSDPTWGQLVSTDYSIEFSFGHPMEGFMLHVRGGGDVLSPICKLCLENNWYAYDCSMGNFIDLANPSSAGWEGFQNYRDRILREGEESNHDS